MSERSGTVAAVGGGGGGGSGGAATAALVSDQEIAGALQSILRETNPNSVSLNGVVQHLESKLGLDLSHKVEFITTQINHFYQFKAQADALAQIQAQAQDHISSVHHHPQKHHSHHHQQQQQRNDRFAPYRNPNYPQHPHFSPSFAVQRPELYGGYRPPPQPQPHLQSHQKSLHAPPQQHPVHAVPHPTSHAVAPVSEPPKVSAQPVKKRRGGPGGLNKLCGVSPELQTIVGQPTLPRTEIVKQLWAYIRKNNLQDPNNKRKIICNDELRLVFEVDCTDMFKMNKLLAKHIIPLDNTSESSKKPKVEAESGSDYFLAGGSSKKPKVEAESGSDYFLAGESSKKPKVEAESGCENVDTVPIVVISEELANFFGTGEREMSQAEVLRQVWEYIKANQLEDPLNSMSIHCDAKLQELFGYESISALGIPEMLAHRHLSNKS